MIYDLIHTNKNSRFSEGSFTQLSDGSILFAYSCYGDYFGDNAICWIGAKKSDDNGNSWTDSQPLCPYNGDYSYRSVSLLKLNSKKLLMMYIAYLPELVDNRIQVQVSSDDGKTWSKPRDVTTFPYPNREFRVVMNNDRLVQLSSGRLIAPVAISRTSEDSGCGYGSISVFYISDDEGNSWRKGKSPVSHSIEKSIFGLQEPGVVSKSDGSLIGFSRTGEGTHFIYESEDGGENWTKPFSSPHFTAPLSPMSIKRNPYNGELIAVWNDYTVSVPDRPPNGRSPLVMAQSRDDGRSWFGHRILESDPMRGYCYTAMLFIHYNILFLAYCFGGPPKCKICLQDIRIRRIKL